MPTETAVLDTFQAIETRRSVKHFDPNFVMPAEDERKLFELAMLSPTSFNMQNWRFVNVKDKALREQIKAASWGQSQVTDASLLVIICGDYQAYSRDTNRYWKNAPDEVRNYIVPMITKFYDGNTQLQRDEALRSGGIASQTLMLAARALGYDSCPMVGFDPVKVAELINLPSDHMIVMLLPIGKAVQPANPRSGPISFEEAVKIDRF